MKGNYPIGVFDSGLGGLNVLKELRRMLPNEDFVYLADNQNCPYGNKTKVEILNLINNAISFFQEYPVKLIVLACNTTSAYLDLIKSDLPILGVVLPTASLTVKLSKNKKIAVLGTNATIDSGVYQNLLQNRSIKELHFLKCSEFVEAIEAGELGNDYSRVLVREKLTFLKGNSLDIIVLACTHFDLYQNEIKIIFPKVKLITSARATAKSLINLINKYKLKNHQKNPGFLKILLTGKSQNFRNQADWILNKIIFESLSLN